MALSNERESFAKYLATAKATELAAFLTRAHPLQHDMDKFLARENGVGIKEVIELLRTGKKREIESARDSIDSYLDNRAARMPMDHLPMSVRREFSVTDARENIALARQSFADAVKSLREKKLGRAYWRATNGITEVMAAGINFIPLKKSERTLALLTGTSMALTLPFAGSAQAAISQNDINAALNDFNTAPHSDNVLGEVSGPLRIVVNGGNVRAQFDNVTKQDNNTDYLYSPFLIQKMAVSGKARQYVAWITEEANKNNVHPVILANQLFRETNHFKAKYIYGPEKSGAGAMGMGQFIESTGNQYGLYTPEDFFDPQKSIAAAARHMRDLLNDYNDDYVLALAAYNGGPGAVKTVRNQLGLETISGREWLEVMDGRYAADKVQSGKVWHVQTREYVGDILNLNWEKNYREWAIKLQGIDPIAFAATGKKRMYAPIPMPLASRPVPAPTSTPSG